MGAWNELIAYHEMQNADICEDCRRTYLWGTLHRTCDECGTQYTDAATKEALAQP